MLDREEFSNLLEAQVLARMWRRQYDHEQPHSSLQYQTPAEFAKTCVSADDLCLRQGVKGGGDKPKSP